MDRDEHRQRLRAYLDTIRRPDKPLEQHGDDEPLVASGLIDSLAILELIIYLESQVGLSFSESGIQPENLRSISAILDVIERHGK